MQALSCGGARQLVYFNSRGGPHGPMHAKEVFHGPPRSEIYLLFHGQEMPSARFGHIKLLKILPTPSTHYRHP